MITFIYVQDWNTMTITFSNFPINRHLFVTLEKVPNSRALWMSHFSDFSQKLLEKEKSKENLSFFSSCFWVEFKGLSSNDNPFITNFQNGILDALDDSKILKIFFFFFLPFFWQLCDVGEKPNFRFWFLNSSLLWSFLF